MTSAKPVPPTAASSRFGPPLATAQAPPLGAILRNTTLTASPPLNYDPSMPSMVVTSSTGGAYSPPSSSSSSTDTMSYGDDSEQSPTTQLRYYDPHMLLQQQHLPHPPLSIHSSNVLFGSDVIQVPLKVEDRNEYVNLVLSHREFDAMAVNIPKYDEMRPGELLAEISRLVKEQEATRKLKQGLSNDSTDSSAVFQARIYELEFELKRMTTKLAASRSLQSSLTDETTMLRSTIRDLETNSVEYEKLYQQNELLREQAVASFNEVARLQRIASTAHAQLREFSSELQALRCQVAQQQGVVMQASQEAFSELLQDVHEREAMLQASYLEEKTERQLITEKYYELSGRIRVFCRLRPPRDADAMAVIRPKPNSILIEKSAKEFSFDQVFGPESVQLDVYQQIEPLVVSFSDGYNACIMAYGQTGTGKTFTMVGNNDPAEDGVLANQGMIPRALQQVFAIVRARQVTYKDVVTVSMVEIYNDQILDLLSEDSVRGGKNAVVKNEQEITQRSVTQWAHVNEVLDEGNANRNIASTSMNLESSRSHALVYLHLESQHRETMEIRKSTLCLVDLAGSERISRSQVEGERLKETQHINKSLSALGDVVYALQHKAKHVPYRNSKLTYMLRDMLSGQAKTLLMLQLSPDDTDVDETTCSLQFGARVSQVQMGAVRQSVESGEIIKLKEENRAMEKKLAAYADKMSELREENARKADQLADSSRSNKDILAQLRTQQQQLETKQATATTDSDDAAFESPSPPSSPSELRRPSSPTLSVRSVSSTASAPAPLASRAGVTRTVKAVRSGLRQPALVADPVLDKEQRRKSLSTLSRTSSLAMPRERSLRSREAPSALPSSRRPAAAVSSSSTAGSSSSIPASPSSRLARSTLGAIPSARTPIRRASSMATASPSARATTATSSSLRSTPSRVDSGRRSLGGRATITSTAGTTTTPRKTASTLSSRS